ncbi:hypothetical protein PAPYR_1457 [Paratrimastix pyriformis]|uniref:Cilia-and flagella-associated protein 96 n=1 Tax=Paratrimastix pyriformis TaxID=342808 RepID=A0ABQ8URP6_9EUKA|nr:hypothetical protein PAPYR_1457 [Paratrimastix pyriformis]
MSKIGGGKEASLRSLDKFGSFGEPAFITIGDPYTQKQSLDDRYKGKQFLTNPPKKGKTKDVTLEKAFNPLFVGDKYVDSSALERQQRAEARKKHPPVASKPWVPSSPPKQSSGQGSMYGTLSPPPAHVPEPPRQAQRRPPEQVGKRGFVPSSPAKRGSYGTPGTLLSHKEFEHSTDPYMPRPPKVKPAAPVKPFNSMSKTGLVFDHNAVFQPDPKAATRAAPAAKPKAAAVKPFVPSSPSRSGKAGAFNKFPEYTPEPPRPAPKKAAPTKVFKPSSASCKSGPTRSILLSSIGPR